MALLLVFTSAATAGSDFFWRLYYFEASLIVYENVHSVRSNSRRCGCGNGFDLGTNPECVARGNSFASPNGGIGSSTRNCNGEPIRYSVSNYAWRSDPEFVDERRAGCKS